jgi:hypothetical protein
VVSSRKIADLEPVAKEIKAKGVKGMAIAAHNAKMEDSKAGRTGNERFRQNRYPHEQRGNQPLLRPAHGPG